MSDFPDRYLGDAVYAGFDGWNVELRVGEGSDSQVIFLEPEVLDELFRYVADLKRHYADQSAIQTDAPKEQETK